MGFSLGLGSQDGGVVLEGETHIEVKDEFDFGGTLLVCVQLFVWHALVSELFNRFQHLPWGLKVKFSLKMKLKQPEVSPWIGPGPVALWKL